MWVPHKLKKKKRKNENRRMGETADGNFILNFFYFLLSLLSLIYGNRTVRIRRGKKQWVLLDEGYA